MARILRPLALLMLLASLLAPAASAQEPGGGVILQVQAPYGPLYRPYSWLPLFATVSNDGPDRVVELRYGHFATQVELPRGARKELVLYVRPEMASKLKVVLTSEGQELATTTIKTQSTIRPVVGVVGTIAAKPKGLDLVQLSTKFVADRPEGFAVLDALVLDGKQRLELTSAQQHAIAAWVSTGGRLLITGGAAVEGLLADLPAELRPATAQANDSGEVETTALANLAGQNDNPGKVAAVRLLPEEGGQIMAVAPDGRPLVVRRLSGRGATLALAVPLDAQALTTWSSMEKLWSILVPGRQLAPMLDPSMGVEQMRDQQAPQALINLPALDLPPMNWLLLLLAAYVLLAGPVSYLVLRRLDRQAWGWVTIPALTAIFAVLAFGVGAQHRSSNLILNQISVVEQGGGSIARIQSYVGIFSPVRAEYTFKVPDAALARPLTSDPWSGNPQLTNALFLQSPSQIQNLKVNQWSMEMLAFESSVEWQGLESDLAMEGTRITGVVTNRSTSVVHSAVLVVGQDVIKLGDLQPGQEVPIDRKVFGGMVTMGEALSYTIFREELQRNGGSPSRELLLRQAAVDMAAPPQIMNNDPRPVLIGWLDQVPLTLQSPDERASHRQTVILVSRPQIGFNKDKIKIDSRWMRLTSTDGIGGGECVTPIGPGINLQNGTTNVSLTIPPELQGLEPNSIFVRPSLEGPPILDKLVLKVLDWQTGEMVDFPGKGGSLENPKRFLTPGGEIQLSVMVPQEVAEDIPGFWGCITPGIEIEGRVS